MNSMKRQNDRILKEERLGAPAALPGRNSMVHEKMAVGLNAMGKLFSLNPFP